MASAENITQKDKNKNFNMVIEKQCRIDLFKK